MKSRAEPTKLEAGARRWLEAERAELEASRRQQAELEATRLAEFEARVSFEQCRVAEARKTTDAERRWLQTERAAFQRQQTLAAVQERQLPVVTR